MGGVSIWACFSVYPSIRYSGISAIAEYPGFRKNFAIADGSCETQETMHFGERLKELRNAAGMSFRRVANATEIGVSTLTDYEAGRRSPSFENVLKICKALNVKCDAFDGCEFTHAEQNPKPRRRK
jgi:DNA-binding XRE family transcriptional regulator